jgi:hypothetical protein
MVLAGDSGVLNLKGDLVIRRLTDYSRAQPGQGRCRTFSVYAPDGTDPPGTGTLAANTDTVLVGPNGSAGWPIAPGAWKDFEDVDPATMCFQLVQGLASQHIFWSYGGTPTGEK